VLRFFFGSTDFYFLKDTKKESLSVFSVCLFFNVSGWYYLFAPQNLSGQGQFLVAGVFVFPGFSMVFQRLNFLKMG
jgi:hypothetical protein